MPPVFAAVITLLTVAPQLVNGFKELIPAITALHKAGLIESTDEQIAQMLAAGARLDSDIAALQAAAGPRPA